MSMLADRRKKTNYCLQPKGKPLHNDSNNFGVKMLEKMGWVPGKGLGRNESGNQEFIRIKYKHDIKGLGYSEKDDQWTEHEKNYNSLLNSLSNYGSDNSNASDVKKTHSNNFNSEDNSNYVKTSGESLEEKSRASRARLHYKKFTKGKDISQYSKKDLANIFGKKSFEISETKVNAQSEAKTGHTEKIDNSLIFNASSSVQDYFKEKMKKRKLNNEDEESSQNLNKYEETKSDKCYKNKITENILEMKAENVVKKKKKSRKVSEDISESINFDGIIQENNTSKSVGDTKVKKRTVKNSDIGDQVCTETLKEECFQIKLCSEKNIDKKFQDEAESMVEKNCLKKKISKQKTKVSDKIDINSPNHQKFIIESRKTTNDDASAEIKVERSKPDVKNTQEESKSNEEIMEYDIQFSDSNVYNFDETNDQNFLEITKYCAEKFRHTNLNGFKGSNLKDLCGYGLPKNFEVKIKTTSSCNEQINNFYRSGIIDISLSDKYGISDKKKLEKYRKKVRKARLLKKKIPNFNVKHLKKKSLFKQVKI
ncbi:PIN2/TERF1-interacting telomerase inhibitor 1 [Condylostylus longicornis]|uniref:PIN2/TERF1-interacting telomerase inhibitor 1 n=1 Tax=Condylostylus longicornis TaxID=2530218 RepID=UPI00244E07A6|nr:PIN2/TERF1-interacting telomerase inhibitor 1 [Condylostylus longicornis]